MFKFLKIIQRQRKFSAAEIEDQKEMMRLNLAQRIKRDTLILNALTHHHAEEWIQAA
jgi:hypothetical protein